MHSEYGSIDWMNVSSKLGHGMTNKQCRNRWENLVDKGKVIIDEAEYMDTALNPDLSYDYDADVKKAFINKRKKGSKRIIWSPEMV